MDQKLLFFIVCCLCIGGAFAGTSGKGFWELDSNDQFLLIFDFLKNDWNLTLKLLKIGNASRLLLSGGKENASAPNPDSHAVYFVLDKFAELLQNPDFLDIAAIVEDEVNKVNTSQIPPGHPDWSLKFSLAHTNYLMILHRVLGRKSIRTILPNLPQGKVNDQCYSDTMDYLDALNYPMKWAIDMFDATGNIPSGLQKANVNFLGSYDQCLEVHAHIPAGVVLGNITKTTSRDFDTRYCRVSIPIPDSVMKRLNANTHGVKVKITWGVCASKACHSDDVKGLFDIGILNKKNIPVESVYCFEDTNLSNDNSAIAAICVLSVFGFLIVVGTVCDVIKSLHMNHVAPEQTYELTRSSDERHVYAQANPAYKKTPDDKTVVVAVASGVSSENECVISNELPPGPDDKTFVVAVANGVSSENECVISNKLSTGPDDKTVVVGVANGVSYGNECIISNKLPPGYVQHREYDKIPETKVPMENGHQSNGNVNPQLDMLKNGTKDEHVHQAIRDKSKEKEGVLVRVFLSFSLYTNVPKLLRAKQTPGSVTCVNGIRFLSLTWVILGHTYNYGIISISETMNAENILDANDMIQSFSFQAVIGGGFAVDTFFLMSAFLLTWLHLKATEKKQKKCAISDYFIFYFHRIWRLTPVYMIVLMTFSCLYKYMGRGPMWPSAIEAADNCKKNWWTNLLYINNVVNTDEQCMGWTWYMANDTMFYIISPIFIMLFYKSPIYGGIFTVLALAAGFTATMVKEYNINGNFFTLKSDGGMYWEQVYITPWCRFGAWAVGIFLGFVFYKRKRGPLKSRLLSVVGWLLATAVALFLVYSTYSENNKDGKPWTRLERAFYEALGRPLWAACVAWLIFACYNHMGGIVDALLSWIGFIPLMRLTYAAYLVHPICMMVYVYTKRNLIHINTYEIVYLFIGHTSITLMVAFVVSACFEAPFMALEKIILGGSNH